MQYLWDMIDSEEEKASFSILIPHKTAEINNRRYLGNKYKLLPFIRRIVDQYCPGITSFADLFSGTGAVASAFTKYRLITNDILYCNYVCHIAWFYSQAFDRKKIVDQIAFYNENEFFCENYMTDHFSDTYYSRKVCSKIGEIREDIEKRFQRKELNDRERAILIASLIYAMDKIAHTCGHYDAYRKGKFENQKLILPVPNISTDLNQNNCCYNEDANRLAERLDVDLVYLDPPYNSRQYSDLYHLLENVARWEKPTVYGIARKMNRDHLKSHYCMNDAEDVFEELIQKIHAKYILLSYNNMAEKGDSRSNAKISDDKILDILKQKGDTSVFSENYRAFSAGRSDIQDNEERLFLCRCYEDQKK